MFMTIENGLVQANAWSMSSPMLMHLAGIWLFENSNPAASLVGSVDSFLFQLAIYWLCHKEGHADPPPSEMTPSFFDCIWCAMFWIERECE